MMVQTEWVAADDKRVPLGPAGRHLIASLQRQREAQGLGYKELAARLTALGRPIPAQGLRRIERGARRVDLDDLLALSRALGRPPITLVWPLGSAAEAEVVPGEMRSVWGAALWFVGERPFPAAEVSTALDGSGYDMDTLRAWIETGSPVPALREHDVILTELAWHRDRVGRFEEAVKTADTDRERAAHESHLADIQERVARLERDLTLARQNMRHRGIAPPPLPTDLAHLDNGPSPTT
jgi:transcriptional regulator with XRE-family HTH domain